MSILALAASFFVGWCFPLGIIGVIAAALALRRPDESLQTSRWALTLGILSLVYSAIWLGVAASEATLLA